MKIIISPAKKLTIRDNTINKKMYFRFIDDTSCLINMLKKISVEEIKQLMSISDNLAKLNFNRYQQWGIENKETYDAILMFNGDVYKGLRADSFNNLDMDFAQENLRILSGLYGLLKPLDSVLPYRLEMGTRLKVSGYDNLYDFWGDKLSKALSAEMQDKDVLVNLASDEYSKALQLSSFPNSIVTPVFKDYKNGKLKVISFFAKKARGEMVNFIVKNKITDPKNLKLFSNDGYKFSNQENGDMLFVR